MKLTFDDFCGPTRPSGEQVNYKNCPVCGSEGWNTYLNPITGMWMCFASQHGGGGRVDTGLPLPGDDYSEVLAHMIKSKYDEEFTPPEIALPEWKPLGAAATSYLAGRGISRNTAAKYGIVERVGSPRILVPVYSESTLAYWTARLYVPEDSFLADGPKFLSAPTRHPLAVYGKGTRYLYVVEGIFDAIAFAETDHNCTAVALLGKSLPKYLRKNFLTLARKYGIIYIVLDPDATRDAFKLQRSLEPLVDRVCIMGLPRGEDPASMFADRRLADFILENI